MKLSEKADRLTEASDAVVTWLADAVLTAARGTAKAESETEPRSTFWLGRLAPEESVVLQAQNPRAERLSPCSVGIRFVPAGPGPWRFQVTVDFALWGRLERDKPWQKSTVSASINVKAEAAAGSSGQGEPELRAGLAAARAHPAMSARLDVGVMPGAGSAEISVAMVNESPGEHEDIPDTGFYEAELSISGLDIQPYLLADLPDSFRYDRSLPAMGINCGVEATASGLRTTDGVSVAQPRIDFGTFQEADLTFEALAREPLEPLGQLVRGRQEWGERVWSAEALADLGRERAWTSRMEQEATEAAREDTDEVGRMEGGLALLREDDAIRRAFCYMNRAMSRVTRGRYAAWRPFQVGFILANLIGLGRPDDDEGVVDLLWFPTGGGKTETYLGYLLTAAFHDRLRGKRQGITGWARFPLRLLSLQQTQRFTDAIAAAELIRREENLPGEPFSVGFFVGEGATPNRIKLEAAEHEPDPDDPDMPGKFRVLPRCPFCGEKALEMRFDRVKWTLDHHCRGEGCPSSGEPLPFRMVDDEIYRFLPTLVVGTLDKAALVGLQASMAGFFGPPRGLCSNALHGFVYAARSSRPNGCLVPGCRGSSEALPQDPSLYAPTLRLQDEVHLLRDSLGAVDGHYEAVLDHLQTETSGFKPRILASSATLAGHEEQMEAIYGRASRVFPLQGPKVSESFWGTHTDKRARQYVALAPRGVTLDFAADRMLTELQRGIRRLAADPAGVAKELGIDQALIPQLLALYGTDVVYGSTLRDIEAVLRSVETQVPIQPLNSARLTGRDPFEDVRRTLERLEKPEAEFEQRIHLVAASSMMSHGVDIDRLNVMVMLGLPLTAAEFIQTTARVGRAWPGLVFVLMKIGRERDAGMLRSFGHFVAQGDRFVEPIPITGKSRRVLEKTLAGAMNSRILHVHEPAAKAALTTAGRLSKYFREAETSAEVEAQALVEAFRFTDPLDDALRDDVLKWCQSFFRQLQAPDAGLLSGVWPDDSGPMRSLRDVEEQVPVLGVED